VGEKKRYGGNDSEKRWVSIQEWKTAYNKTRTALASGTGNDDGLCRKVSE